MDWDQLIRALEDCVIVTHDTAPVENPDDGGGGGDPPDPDARKAAVQSLNRKLIEIHSLLKAQEDEGAGISEPQATPTSSDNHAHQVNHILTHERVESIVEQCNKVLLKEIPPQEVRRKYTRQQTVKLTAAFISDQFLHAIGAASGGDCPDGTGSRPLPQDGRCQGS